MIAKVTILIALVGVALSSYPGAYGPYRYGLARPYGRAYAPAPVKVVKVETDETPKPFQFSYDIVDEDGNVQARQESGDESGVVKGTYGYRTLDGITRQVEYVADENGFRANIKTNEPGTDNQNPANVNIESAATIVEEKAPEASTEEENAPEATTEEETAPEATTAEEADDAKLTLGLGLRAPYYGHYGYGHGLYGNFRRGSLLGSRRGYGYGHLSPFYGHHGLTHRRYSPYRYGGLYRSTKFVKEQNTY